MEALYTVFTCFGPVARTCLRSIHPNPQSYTYEHDLATYLGQVDREIRSLAGQLSQILGGGLEQESSSTIVLMEPNHSGLSFTVRVMSRFIAHRMAGAEPGRFYELLQYLSKNPALRTSATWLFEAYAHEWLRRGGEFKADELPITDTNSLPLTFCITASGVDEISYFTTGDDLAKKIPGEDGGSSIGAGVPGKYFHSCYKTPDSFDGLVFNDHHTLILMRFTMAKTHTVKPHGVRLLLQALPATIKTVCIIFVVPADRAKSYSNAQKVPTASSIGPGVRIKQYRLVFRDQDIEGIAAQRSQSPRDEGMGMGEGRGNYTEQDYGESLDDGSDSD